MKTTKQLWLAAAISVALANFAQAQSNTPAARPAANAHPSANSGVGDEKFDHQTQKFFKEAAIGGMAEVALGKIATENAANAEVKQFGDMMVKDHTSASTKLMDLAAEYKITLPTELDRKHKRAVEKLSEKKGADFDKAYMGQMVKDHKATIDLFEDQVKKGKVADVNSFAQTTLPTLQEHLKLAQPLEDTVKKAK